MPSMWAGAMSSSLKYPPERVELAIQRLNEFSTPVVYIICIVIIWMTSTLILESTLSLWDALHAV
ncbi:hypothetical protein M433DRAFT_151077 [Acidomyces richmondensis BFW]|nr:MAG: hypothetical protein FE78DRAFT_84675 [Acidomyces sp. 'richmondensis']KYG48475.1 hypothetical protein M433DRAFT_151077 [Acidomyces richmondensis BFW]